MKDVLSHCLSNITNMFKFGSQVYGNLDNFSDKDYIVVVSDLKGYIIDGKQIKIAKHDYIFYDNSAWINKLEKHDIDALECYFLTNDINQEGGHIFINNGKFNFELDLEKLRTSVSSKASNSWAKAKKKIEVENDIRTGQKSLFHSLRILMFGIQIAELGMIVDYSEANKYYKDILTIDNYSVLKEKYQPIYNKLKSKFKIVAPIEKSVV